MLNNKEEIGEVPGKRRSSRRRGVAEWVRKKWEEEKVI